MSLNLHGCEYKAEVETYLSTQLLGHTIRNLLQVFENAKVVSKVSGQNNVSNQIKHPLVVLRYRTTKNFSLHMHR